MRKDLTEIVVLLDRSGSMISCREEAESGLNHFIKEQKKLEGEVKFTLVQFDNVVETVHSGVSIHDVPDFTLLPRGLTALYDAIGKTINKLGERLSGQPEEQRPGLVIFVILTDGDENASCAFKREQIKEMIELQQNTYSWKFTYLGANQDAISNGERLGIVGNGVVNYSTHNSRAVFSTVSNQVNNIHSSFMAGTDVMDWSYSEKEKKEML